jgi:hypothetical protein
MAYSPNSNHITLLFQQWESSQNRSWLIFQKYLCVFNNVTVHQPESDKDYVFKASLNGSSEKMKEYSARQLKKKILKEPQITPPHVLRVLRALMDKRTSMALITMSRWNKTNCIKNHNHTFKTAIQRKLRLLAMDCHQDYKCKCGSQLDAYEDHCLGCKVNHKTKVSNGIRDKITKVSQHILPIVKMIDSPKQVETELHCTTLYPAHYLAPRLTPFDLSIRLDHSLDTRCW